MRGWWAVMALVLAQPNALPQTADPGRRTHWNASRGYAPFRFATPAGVVIDDTLGNPLSDSYLLKEGAEDFSLRFTAANSHNHPSKSYPYREADGSRRKVSAPSWGFYVKMASGDSLVVRVKTVEIADPLSSEGALSVSVAAGSRQSEEIMIKEGIDCYTGKNNWLLSVTSGTATLFAGNRSLSRLLSFATDGGGASEFGFIAFPGASLSVADISFSDNGLPKTLLSTKWTDQDLLHDYISASSDPLEGYWCLFDRALEESLLQLGGNYRFAIVREGDRYLLLYMGGATVNAGVWTPGMVKAHLIPDSFPGIFDVVWIDSQGLALSNAIKAQCEEGDVLSIQFPYHSSSLRLRKANGL